MDRFRTMQSFVRVVRAGSFTLAAQQLGMSRALISRHISDLETRLGVRLLNRSTRALDLTEEGRRYLEFCEQVFSQIEASEKTRNGISTACSMKSFDTNGSTPNAISRMTARPMRSSRSGKTAASAS